MRKLFGKFLLIAVLFAGFDVVAQDEITDEDLKNYAIIELAKNSITSQISPMVNDLIAKQEGMTGQRFSELKGTKGDKAKLDAIKALEWEVKFLDVVNKQIAKKTSAAGEVVKVLASNGLGAAKYKAVKAALKSDPEVKSKFDAILQAMNNAGA